MKRTTRNKKNIDLSLVLFIHVHLFLINLCIYIHTFIHFLSDFMVTFPSWRLTEPFQEVAHRMQGVESWHSCFWQKSPSCRGSGDTGSNWWMRVSSMQTFSKEGCMLYIIYIYMFSWNTVHPGFLKLPPHFIGHSDLCYWGRFIILTQQIDWLLLPIWNRQGCTNNH